MTATCPNYQADPSYQIGAGATGPYDCTAHAMSDVIDASTCGAKDPGGRTIRLQSDEPVPDPTSPGLNLSQVAQVAGTKYGVYVEVFTGARALAFDEYERRSLGGQASIAQISYAPIAASSYDAFGSTFFGGHAIAETHLATYDPGADGRRAGIFRYDGHRYPRELIKRAAGELVIGRRTDGSPRKVGYGKIWCAFGRDVVPNYRVVMPARDYFVYTIAEVNGVKRITGRVARHTGGFSATCSPPKSYRWPANGKTYALVRVTSGFLKGQYIGAQWAKEV